MTRILLTPVRRALTTTAATARLTARPSFTSRVESGLVVLPDTAAFAFTAASAPVVDLPAPDIGWAWVLRLDIDGVVLIERVVTFTGDVVTWAALTDVDPDTLQTEVPPAAQPAWAAALQQLSQQVQGVSYQQAAPSAQWSIPHTLGRRPAVAVYSATGALLLADVQADAGLVVITFANPTAGSAVLT